MKWTKRIQEFNTDRFAIVPNTVKITIHESQAGIVFKKDNRVYIANNIYEVIHFMIGGMGLAHYPNGTIKKAKYDLDNGYRP